MDGVIELERLEDVLHVGRPIHARAKKARSSCSRLERATVFTHRGHPVQVGRTSVNMIEIRAGPGCRRRGDSLGHVRMGLPRTGFASSDPLSPWPVARRKRVKDEPQ